MYIHHRVEKKRCVFINSERFSNRSTSVSADHVWFTPLHHLSGFGITTTGLLQGNKKSSKWTRFSYGTIMGLMYHYVEANRNTI